MFTEAIQNWGLFALAGLLTASVLAYWIFQTAAHEARLRRIPIRVHVNGIRGKSTIVRYVAGALREGGIETVAKTTGSATRVIHPDGREEPLRRNGAPTIIEQIEVLRRAARPSTGAIVFECMALQTEYQKVSEDRMIQATDGIIANVRHDHVEQLGDTLPEIARSLSSTAPVGARLYTAETDPQLCEIMGRAARRKGSELVRVRAEEISEAERRSLSPLAFPENVALAVAIAGRHGVPREVALQGVRKAAPDPGVLRCHRHALPGGDDLFWFDLFGINDVESAEMNIARLAEWIGTEGRIVFVLNNRADRQHRTLQFAAMAADSAVAAKVLLIGDSLQILQEAIGERSSGMEAEILEIPDDADAAFLAGAAGGGEDGRTVLIGLANIHTADATRLRGILETSESAWDPGDEAEKAETCEPRQVGKAG